ncbi:hypothetical protein [Helicobacter cinaedi]|nr:hypothetical protein [Helicobacter cinaedi]
MFGFGNNNDRNKNSIIIMLGEMIEITKSHKGKAMAIIMPTIMIETKK